jgi:hypothetical protein
MESRSTASADRIRRAHVSRSARRRGPGRRGDRRRRRRWRCPAGRRRRAASRSPASAMQAATLTAVVVLPTPPFWLAMAYTMPMTSVDASGGRGGSGRYALIARKWCGLSAASWQSAGVSSPFRPAAGTRAAWDRSCAARAAFAARTRGTGLRTARARRPTRGAQRRPPRLEPRPRRLLPSSDEDAAIAQQWCGVLAEDRERRQSSRTDHVAASDTVVPLLGPRPDHLGVGKSHGRDRGRRNSHLRPADSTSTTRASGSAVASARPGSPAPAPRSATTRAERTSAISRPVSESAMWT